MTLCTSCQTTLDWNSLSNLEFHCRLETKAVLGTETNGPVANMVATGVVMLAFHAI